MTGPFLLPRDSTVAPSNRVSDEEDDNYTHSYNGGNVDRSNDTDQDVVGATCFKRFRADPAVHHPINEDMGACRRTVPVGRVRHAVGNERWII